jgi:hypothetical protein
MNSSPSLLDNEKILKTIRANRVQGIRAVGGHLFLTSERLIFLPHRLDRWFRGSEWARYPDQIESAQLSPRGRYSPYSPEGRESDCQSCSVIQARSCSLSLTRASWHRQSQPGTPRDAMDTTNDVCVLGSAVQVAKQAPYPGPGGLLQEQRSMRRLEVSLARIV